MILNIITLTLRFTLISCLRISKRRERGRGKTYVHTKLQLSREGKHAVINYGKGGEDQESNNTGGGIDRGRGD